MKHVFAGTCLAAAFAVSLAAQTPAQTPAQSDRDDKTVTLTGCVRTGAEPGSFVLANVKHADKSTGTEPSVTGTSGTAGMAKGLENSTIELEDAPSSVKLSEHVGHTVQVTGEIDKDSDHAMGRPSTAGATGTSGTAGEQTGARSASTGKPDHSLKVKTLTMVSASCSY